MSAPGASALLRHVQSRLLPSAFAHRASRNAHCYVSANLYVAICRAGHRLIHHRAGGGVRFTCEVFAESN